MLLDCLQMSVNGEKSAPSFQSSASLEATTAYVTTSPTNVPVTAAIDHLFVLNALGNTGKTFLINAIHELLEVQRT